MTLERQWSRQLTPHDLNPKIREMGGKRKMVPYRVGMTAIARLGMSVGPLLPS